MDQAILRRWMGLGLLLGSFGAIALPPHSAIAQPTGLCPAQLAPAIDQIIHRPEFQRWRWGILIQTVAAPGDRQTLYAQDADRYFLPASTVKLMTTAAVLEQLGPDARMRTSVYQWPSGTEMTALQLVGRGDPSFSQDDLADLAQQVRDRGIGQIDQFIIDDQFFPGSAVNFNWEWEDVQAGYGAPVNSLILDENEIVLDLIPQAIAQPLQVQWRHPDQAADWRIENYATTVAADQPEFVQVGRDLSQPILRVYGQLRVGSAPEDASIAVMSPARNFGRQWQLAIARQGVAVGMPTLATTPLPPAAIEIAWVESPPVADLVAVANQSSNNLYAEALLKYLGQVAGAQGGDGLADRSTAIPIDATAAGLAVLAETLTRLGVDPTSYDLADGSGLSRHNLTSPAALVQTLQGMAASPHAAVYRDSLAIAGVQGTLRYRFQDTPLAGHLYGKSGTITGNAALAGYVELPDQPPLAFSIFLNHTTQNGAAMRQAIDAVMLQIARLQPCP